jgi:hypothetical protein
MIRCSIFITNNLISCGGLWQQQNPEERLSVYYGHIHRLFIEMASLDNEIHMRGLALNTMVQEVRRSKEGRYATDRRKSKRRRCFYINDKTI